MDIKECVEFLEMMITPGEIIFVKENMKVEINEYIKKIEEIIKKLQIFEELIENYGDMPLAYPTNFETLNFCIKKLEEKYFPKIIKKTITIGMEAKEKEIEHCIKTIKSFVLRKRNFSKDAKFEIKEND